MWALLSVSAPGHPEEERSKGHWFIRLSSLPPVTQERSREGRGVSTEDNFRSEKIFSVRAEKRNKNKKNTECWVNTYVCGNHPPVPEPFLPALAALWLSSSLSLLSLPLSLSLQPFSHSGGGAVLPEKVRTQISRHFLYTALTHCWCVQGLLISSDIWPPQKFLTIWTLHRSLKCYFK